MNYDVLSIIVAHSTCKTILQLMRTCRSLYSEGAKFLPDGDVVVDGRKDDSVLSLASFMAAEDGRRWRYPKSVSIKGRRLRYEVAKVLADAISRVRHINRLELCDADSTLSMHPDMIPAFTSLR